MSARRYRYWPLLVAAALGALAPLVPVIHLALSKHAHRFCLIHGRLEEVSDDRPVAAAAPGLYPHNGPRPDSGAQHRICLASAPWTPAPMVAPLYEAGVLPLAPRAGPSMVQGPLVHEGLVLSFAPKHSPPEA